MVGGVIDLDYVGAVTEAVAADACGVGYEGGVVCAVEASDYPSGVGCGLSGFDVTLCWADLDSAGLAEDADFAGAVCADVAGGCSYDIGAGY